MKIETKYKIGDIVNFRFFKDDKPEKFLIAMITIRDNGIYYYNGTDTRYNLSAREEQLNEN